ncbi:MAG TPA: hypothetical protein VN957_27550 [Chthoniobacterales bacterium]|nr:hypothetical protein [Chthoniobacterales bacterium]
MSRFEERMCAELWRSADSQTGEGARILQINMLDYVIAAVIGYGTYTELCVQ